MADVVRARLRRSSIDEIESTMTLAQIQLHFHWEMRGEKRRIKLDEMALKRAIGWAFGN